MTSGFVVTLYFYFSDSYPYNKFPILYLSATSEVFLFLLSLVSCLFIRRELQLRVQHKIHLHNGWRYEITIKGVGADESTW